MAGFLSGLASLAEHAIGPGLNTLAARKQGQMKMAEQERQRLLQELMFQRQQQQDDVARAVARSTMSRNAAQASAATRVPGTYKIGADGAYHFFPSRVAPTDASLPFPGSSAPPSAPAGGGERVGYSPGAKGSVTLAPKNPAALSPSTTQRASGDESAGDQVGVRATGVLAPPQRQPAGHQATGMVKGRAVVGTVGPNGLFQADTTASGDTLYARPRAVRSGGASDPEATQLNHAITNVRAQIADTQRQQNALSATIRAANEPFATPEAKAAGAAAQAQAQALSTRLDSLRSVNDRLIQQQQQSGGIQGVPVKVQGAPVRAPQLSPEDMQGMQGEFDQASADLQAVLRSSAPDSIKQQARALYNAHQLEVARKYSLQRPSGAQPPLAGLAP